MICNLCGHGCHCDVKCEVDVCLCPTCDHKKDEPMIKQIKKWWKKYVNWLFDWK